MLPEVISTLSDYIATLGLDVFKEKFQKPLDEKKLKKEIKTYIESQRKYNDICSLNEEIDFQSLFEYVTNNLFDTVMICSLMRGKAFYHGKKKGKRSRK